MEDGQGEAMALEAGYDDVQEELDSLQVELQPQERAEAADLVRALFSVGASPVAAKALLSEVFSPPRVTAHASRYPHFGVLPGGAFDLRPGPDGRSLDFENPDDCAECERRLAREKPYLLIGCPPCTDWSIFNVNMNYKHMDPEEVERRRRRARLHLEFVIKLYRQQLARGAHFLHEHPATADSWDEPSMQELLAIPGVGTVVGHMCRQGMRIQAPDGRILPVRKPTRWASSAPEVLKRLGLRCTNEGCRPGDPRWHEHTVLEGRLPGGELRTQAAARYPLPSAPASSAAWRRSTPGRAAPCPGCSGSSWTAVGRYMTSGWRRQEATGGMPPRMRWLGGGAPYPHGDLG